MPSTLSGNPVSSLPLPSGTAVATAGKAGNAGAPRAAADSGAVADSADPAARRRLERAAVSFEGMFIAQMLDEMRKTTEQLKEDNGFRDHASDAIMEHANRLVADAIAQQRAFGIADTLIAQMTRPADADPHR